MAKTKTPAGEKCERKLPFKLNDEDKARKGELAGKLNKQLEAAVEAKKIEMKKHNEKISKFTKQISSELKFIETGIEHRAVTCTAVKNYEKNVIEFWFENEVLESVTMTPADRQLDLKDADKKVNGNKKPNEKWQKLAPKYKPKTDEEPENEIATVHKLETSKKGASSMVDPK